MCDESKHIIIFFNDWNLLIFYVKVFFHLMTCMGYVHKVILGHFGTL
jgi:hypothetical protein